MKKSLADDADFRPYTWKRWVFLDRRWKAGLAQLRQLLKELRVQKTEFLYDFMGLEYKGAPRHVGRRSKFTNRFGWVLIGSESHPSERFVAHVKASKGKWGDLARAGKWGDMAIGKCLHIVANIVYETDRSAEMQQMGYFGSWTSSSYTQRNLPNVSGNICETSPADSDIMTSVMALEIAVEEYGKWNGDGEALRRARIAPSRRTFSPYFKAVAWHEDIYKDAEEYETSLAKCMGYYDGSLGPPAKTCPAQQILLDAGTSLDDLPAVKCDIDHRHGDSRAEMSYCIDKHNMHRYGFTGLKRTRLSQGGGGAEGAEQGLPYRTFAGANPEL